MLTSNTHVRGHGGADMNSPLPEGWDFSRHFTSPFFSRVLPFSFGFLPEVLMPCIPGRAVGSHGPAPPWPCTRAHAGAYTHVILAHVSTRCAWQVCRHSGSHSQVHPWHALGGGPRWTLMLEEPHQYRNPSVLCSQPQNPPSGANYENLPSLETC